MKCGRYDVALSWEALGAGGDGLKRRVWAINQPSGFVVVREIFNP